MGETRGQETYSRVFRQKLELGHSSLLKMLVGKEKDPWWWDHALVSSPLGSGGDLLIQYGQKLRSRCQSCPWDEISAV